jgi:hypothetical protein
VDGVSGIPKAYVQILMSFQLQARLTLNQKKRLPGQLRQHRTYEHGDPSPISPVQRHRRQA